MSKERSKGIVGIFVLMTFLFFIFLIFAFYTISSLKESSKFVDSEYSSENAPIAVVEISGAIMKSKKAIKLLHKAEKDKKVKAIILRIDSPGGAVGPTQEIYEEIRRIDTDVKPIYASFGSIAASGGYYIGAGTRKIYSNAGTLTGSIGVIMQFADMSKLYELARVRPETIKAGKYKDIGSNSRAMTVEERALMDEMINKVHDQFISDIEKVRKKRIKGDLREYAQGQIFSGEGALERGLVDEIAGLWEAARRIHKELKMKEEFGIKYIKAKKKFKMADFLSNLDDMEERFQNLFRMKETGAFFLFGNN